MTIISAKDLMGMPVVDARKGKRVGKVSHLVFYPDENRLAGFTVRRPDAALMFKRKDRFVRLGGFDVESGSLIIRDDPSATDEGARKALGLDWDACVLWMGMPVLTEDGRFLGYVDDVRFDAYTGCVEQLSTETAKAKDVLLGHRVVTAELIRGFRRGQGIALAPLGSLGGAQDEPETQRGALVVDAAAADLVPEGGAAAAAGKASAILAKQARKRADAMRKGVSSASVTVKAKVEDARAQAKPHAEKAGASAEEVIGKGAYAAGEQVAKIGGMFAAFKDEFTKGWNGEYNGEDDSR